MVARFRHFVGVAALVSLGSCAHGLPRTGPASQNSEAFVILHGHALRLHLSQPLASNSSQSLLVYATGDAGWWGKDREIFSHVRSWGYPAVGFSAREYVHHLGKSSVGAAEVASDYQAIIRASMGALGLPALTRVVLIGKSRGAGLSVAAAVDPAVNAMLAGVLAVGLTREEEYVHGRVNGSPSLELAVLQTYARLADIGDVPVAVIQATHDDYVPAREARQLFGPDTPSRELVAIEARDHNFSGVTDVLYREMSRSLQWIAVHR